MLSQEQINTIRKLYLEGKQKNNIAEIVGCSLPTVTKYTKDLTFQKNDIIGKRFGKLTVLELAEKDNTLASRCLRYKCKCDCGKEIITNSGSLRSGHTTSCGCNRKGKIKDLTNQRFGLLTVLKKTEKRRNRKVGWLCKCDCGNEIIVYSSDLINGDIKSCGCLKNSYGEIKIKNFLKDMNISFETQYCIKDCKNIKPLPFDFAIFNNNSLICLIEYQGDIHFKSTGGWNSKEDLILRQKRDNIKREYCLNNNIKLVEIPYTDLEKIDEEYIRKVIYD